MFSIKRQSGQEGKIQNKLALQQSLGWPAEPKRPMLCLPAGMSEKLGGKLLEELLPGLLALPVEILVVGKGSAAYGMLFTKLAREHRHRMHIVADKEEPLRLMYGASDMALFIGDPGGVRELQICLASGVVPVSPPSPVLDDYDPVQESGNAFLFESPNVWLCFAALVRAMETYKLPFDWRTIQRNGMEAIRTRA
ncbi:hypothetical protein HYW84_00975 [Candidatus Peregrinibacteria bacterium]|nr:hypothetical protein [Candidatus Peregrinibacteria bacterium]